MQPCEDRIPALVDAASGELSGAERAALNEHLLQCPACRAELRMLEQTTSLLTETSRTPEDFSIAGFATRTADRAEKFRDRSARGLWWSVTRGVRIALSMSGAALAASLALFAMTPRTHSVTRVPAPAATTANVTTSDSWETYIPEAVNMVHDNGDSVGSVATDPASLDDGLETLSDDELETLTLSLNPS